MGAQGKEGESEDASLPERRLQPLRARPGVDHGAGDAPVVERFLHQQHVPGAAVKVQCESMAHAVGRQRPPDARLLEPLTESPLDVPVRDPPATGCGEERAGGPVPDVAPEVLAELLPEEDLFGAVTLGADGRLAGLQVEGLCLALDTGHCLVTGEREPAAAVAEFAPRIGTVAIEDMARGVHVHLPFGEGDMDVPGVLDALEGIGFGKLVCVELSRESHRADTMIPKALDYLRNCRRPGPELPPPDMTARETPVR